MKPSVIVFCFCLVFLIFAQSVSAGIQEEIDARNRQIEEIQRQIDQYQSEIESASGKSRTLASEIDRLNAQINKIKLEIKSLEISIGQTRTEITITQGQIGVLNGKLGLQKTTLAKYIKILDQSDRQNLTQIFFKNAKLSDFFNNLKNIEDNQSNLKTAIVSMKDTKANLESKEDSLQDKKQELEQLRLLQESQRRNVNQQKTAKDSLLKETKGQEAKFQELVRQSQQDIQAIRDQIFYLLQNGVSVEDAIKFGQLAALRIGIRPAFLIAILEVESGLGKNVGTGNWLDDMYKCYLRLGKPSRAEVEKSAFLEITSKLGLNPDTVRVSREPNYGCGGALGPAQFLPSTWLGYEDAVADLTGHRPPNPWNIEDAFMASAVKLSKAGALNKDKAGETAAAKAYISGNSKCNSSICNYYARITLTKAEIIERSL